MKLEEWKDIKEMLHWCRGKVYTDSMIRKLLAAERIVDREIRLRTMDVTKNKSDDFKIVTDMSGNAILDE